MLRFFRSKGGSWDNPDDAVLPDPVPWDDTAILFRQAGRHKRTFEAEGSLYDMVRRIQAIPQPHRSTYRLLLPDRRRLPLAYMPKHFGALIRKSYWAKA